MHCTILVYQVCWYMYLYISRVSGERLQDHWSSGCLQRTRSEMMYKLEGLSDTMMNVYQAAILVANIENNS